MIRAVCDADAEQLTKIYNHYIEHSIATFEEQPISAKDMLARLSAVANDNLPWLAAVDNTGNIDGYAYASVWKARSAYRFTVEVTVYLSSNATGRGLGTQLYKALFSELSERSIKNVLACISLPNPESVSLHEKFDMQQVAYFKKVGIKFGEWIDVGYWQGVLE